MKRYRCEFTLGKRSAKGLRPVYRKDGGRVVGYICEMWGKGAGYFWRTSYNGVWSELPEKTMRAAILKLGEML